ncbi:MAG: hypothetical protein ACRDL5_02080, partial [Solirubrobacteraceae bacterium]
MKAESKTSGARPGRPAATGPGASIAPARAGGSDGGPACGDTSLVAPRLTSDRFVGRVGELAELQLAVREA